MGDTNTSSLAELETRAVEAIKAVFPSVSKKVIDRIECAASYDDLSLILAGLHFDLDTLRNPQHEKLQHDLRAVRADANHMSVMANAKKRAPFMVQRSIN